MCMLQRDCNSSSIIIRLMNIEWHNHWQCEWPTTVDHGSGQGYNTIVSVNSITMIDDVTDPS